MSTLVGLVVYRVLIEWLDCDDDQEICLRYISIVGNGLDQLFMWF